MGVVIFAIVLSKVLSSVDNAYWNTWRHSDCFGNLMYPVLVLFALFIFRGDLMSSFAYLFGMVVSMLGFAHLYKRKYVERNVCEKMYDH